MSFLFLSLLCLTAQVLALDTQSILDRTQEAYDSFVSKLGREYGVQNIDAFKHGWRSMNDDPIYARFMRAIVDTQKFHYVFTGTSVTAAGDCYWNESYVNWVDDLFKPIALASGVQFKASNIAQGKNPSEPYTSCLDAYAGFDLDAISWEQDMMCGRRNSKNCVEKMMRVASLLENNPMMAPILVAPRKMSSTKWLGMVYSPLASTYQDNGFHSLAISDMFNFIDNLEDPRFSSWEMYDKGKTFGHASWHPSPYGHKLTGYSIAMLYATKWMEAVKKMNTMDEISIRKFITEWGPDRPLPKDCRFVDSEVCSASKVTCKTMYTPRLNPEGSLIELVSNAKVLNYIYENPQEIDTPHWKAIRFVGTATAGDTTSSKSALIGNFASGPIEFSFITSVTTSSITMCGPYHIPESNNLFQFADIHVDGDLRTFDEFSYCMHIGDATGKGQHTVKVTPRVSSPDIWITTLFWVEH